MKKTSLINRQNSVNIGLLILLNLICFFPFLAKANYFSGSDFEWLYPFGKAFEKFHEPLTHLFFHFCLPIFDFNPIGYYLIGFIFHVLNAILVYFLLLLIIKSKSVAFLTSLFFSIHPAHAIVTLGINHMDTKIATLFYLLSLIFFIRFIKTSSFLKREIFYLVSLILFIFGLASKLTLYSLPMVIIIYGLLYIDKSSFFKSISRIFIRTGPFLVIAITHLIILIFKFPEVHHAWIRMGNIFSKPAESIIDVAIYMKLMFISPLIQYFPSDHINFLITCNSLLIVVSFILIIFLIQSPKYRFSMAWILFTIFTYSGRWEINAKVLYLPLIGWCLFLSLLIQDGIDKVRIGAKKGKISIIVKIVVILGLLFSFYSSLQNRILGKAEITKIIQRSLSTIKSSLRGILGEEVVIYAFYFPTYIEGLNAFHPVLTRMFYFNPLSYGWKSINQQGGDWGNLSEHLYTVMINREIGKDRDLFELHKLKSEPGNKLEIYENYILGLEPGMNGRISSTLDRYIFAYHNGETFDITEKVYPKSKVVFKVRSSGARSISIVGDFNEWNKDRDPLKLNPEGIWTGTLELASGRYRYKFVINGEKWVNNPDSAYYDEHPKFGKVSILPIVNPALPIGLLPSGDDAYDRIVMETKKKLMIEPDNASFHKKLGDLFKEKGFDFNLEAELEYAEAEYIIGNERENR